MKISLHCALLLGALFLYIPAFAAILPNNATTLSGRVTDAVSGEPLTGVSLYLPDLKIGAYTDENGHYSIGNLPQRSLTIQVHFLGYKQLVEKIDLNTVSVRDFALQPTITEVNEVVVTGVAQSVERNRTPTPITVVTTEQLLQSASTNIISALTRQPGIAQITTGAGISKPVIRGLGYNRVVVVNDGIRQEGQQWGDEHGIEIDEFSVSKVEILKGPASLSYGSDAMAGVINMLSAPTLPEGKITGNILASYQTNNGLVGLSGNFMGNRKGYIWDVRYSQKAAHAYKNAYDGYVYGSGFRENNVGGIVGINRPWGYSHLHFSAYNLTPGIVEGERDEDTGQFIKPVALDDQTEGEAPATDADFKSYHPGLPYQQVYHYKAVLNNSFILGESTLKATLGFQQNRRQEYEDVFDPKAYGLYFLLNTINYDVKYLFPEKNNFNVTLGANGMQQQSFNKGTEYLVPEYGLFDLGLYGIGRKTVGDWDFSGGLRFDTRRQQTDDLYLNADEEKVDGPGPDITQRFEAFKAAFSGVSGSFGLTYQLSEAWYAKANVSRGYRAPNIGELGANGVHDGTTRYEIGDPNLKPEHSWEVDLSLGVNSEHVTAELDLFSNNIQNFIFSQKLNTPDGRDSLIDGYQAFRFVAGNARLAGGEFSIDIHPHPVHWLHFENTFSYVQAVQAGEPDSTRYLPFTPGPKWSSELRAEAKTAGRFLNNAYARVRLDQYFAQNNFYSAFGTETATPAYTLLELGVGADVMHGKHRLFTVMLTVNNLTDAAYQNHLSRLKYGAVNNVTGRTGVYDMGRNMVLKVVAPINRM